jgi:uncharacterized membrane protein YqjE
MRSIDARRDVVTTSPTEPQESIGELLGQLANNSAVLVRDEITLARKEITERVQTFAARLITVCIGSLVGLLGVMTLVAAAVIGLGRLVGMGTSALIIGAALAVIGGTMSIVGLNRLKQTSLKPEKTIETLGEDKEWLKQLT